MKKRNIEVEIVADSVNPSGKRITSFLVTYPRFIHAEIMTHRMLSRNAASSRAIPIEKTIEAVRERPAHPERWGMNGKGMQDHGMKSDTTSCEWSWDVSAAVAIDSAESLNDEGLHKQIVNRVLEPFSYITVLITATEWDNFFMLRAHKDAQPEFQVLAYRMLDAYMSNKPIELSWGGWHTPLVSCNPDYDGDEVLIESVANCARTSYTTHDKEFTIDQQEKLVNQLRLGGHWSPFEHQAQACNKPRVSTISNFKGGWSQYRQHVQMGMDKPIINLPEILANKPDWVKL